MGCWTFWMRTFWLWMFSFSRVHLSYTLAESKNASQSSESSQGQMYFKDNFQSFWGLVLLEYALTPGYSNRELRVFTGVLSHCRVLIVYFCLLYTVRFPKTPPHLSLLFYGFLVSCLAHLISNAGGGWWG